MVLAVVTARRLEPARRAAVANVLAEAFEHDPMQAWLFPNAERRIQRLRRFYERDLAARLEGRTTTCLLGQAAVACWQAPGESRTLPLRSALQLAPCFWSVAAHHPFAGMRLLAAVLRQRPDEPHWYLSHLAVRPDDQGRGLGRTLLHWGIERADEEGVGTYLETANPDNLPFYQSAGYSQVGLVPVWSGAVMRPTCGRCGADLPRRDHPRRSGGQQMTAQAMSARHQMVATSGQEVSSDARGIRPRGLERHLDGARGLRVASAPQGKASGLDGASWRTAMVLSASSPQLGVPAPQARLRRRRWLEAPPGVHSSLG